MQHPHDCALRILVGPPNRHPTKRGECHTPHDYGIPQLVGLPYKHTIAEVNARLTCTALECLVMPVTLISFSDEEIHQESKSGGAMRGRGPRGREKCQLADIEGFTGNGP
jgi:hypothetical protein